MSWWRLASMQGGVISRRQLLGHGISKQSADRMLACEQLTAVVPGVYLVRGAPLTYLAGLWVAVIATGGALGYRTAAGLWGVERVTDRPVHVIVPMARRRVMPEWVTIHRSDLPPQAIRERDGLPVTSRAWSVLDYLTTLEPTTAGMLVDRAIQRRWVTTADFDERLREFPNRRGNLMLRRLRPMTADGAAAESERRLHRLLRAAGISSWRANYGVWASGELVAVVDVAIPSCRLAIEVDGMAYHVDAERFRRDRSRQNQLTVLGWTVLRFTWSDLVDRPDYVVGTIRRLAA